jgi:hypothetical protein
MRHALKSLLTLGLLAAALALPGVAQAAEVGQVCNITTSIETAVVARYSDGSGFAEYIHGGDGWRIDAFAGAYYQGHRNGGAEGYIPREWVNQGTCHW